MNKKNNNKGFTLAELLIVVAIIAVLVAIAIPVFTNQLEKSREATDLANIRSAYAQVTAEYLDSSTSKTATVSAKQTGKGWVTQGSILGFALDANTSSTTASKIGGKQSKVWTIKANKSGTITIDNQTVKSGISVS